jgi:hypothetical protein
MISKNTAFTSSYVTLTRVTLTRLTLLHSTKERATKVSLRLETLLAMSVPAQKGKEASLWTNLLC